MAPAAQKKAKKHAVSTPAAKNLQHEEKQEAVVKEEADEQKPGDAAASADLLEAAVAEAADKEESIPANASEAADRTTEAEIEEMEGDDAGDVDEELEEAEGEEEEEEAEDVDHGSEEKAAEEAVAMRNEDALNGERDDGQGNAPTDGVSKNTEDDNFGPFSGKIFIGGLSRETTTEVLTRHFEKYGELTDSVIMKHRSTGQPRGFGFVTYADSSIVDKVLEDTHVIDGRTVDAKRTVPREKMSVPMKGPKTKKIFVGGLTSSTKEDDLKAYFGKFGGIAACQIMQDHKVGKSRGFGFVTFDTEQVVEEILARGKMHEIDGKQVEIKKAEPKVAVDPLPVLDRTGYMGARRPGPGAGPSAGAYGANPGFYGGFHAADAPMYGAGGYFNRAAGRPGGLAYGDTYGYGGGYGAPYGYGEFDEGYGSMAYNHVGYGSGSVYGYNYGGGGGGYGSSSRSYGSGRYHPYSR